MTSNQFAVLGFVILLGLMTISNIHVNEKFQKFVDVNNLVLLRTYTTTVVTPGYIGGPPMIIKEDGSFDPTINSVAVTYPPKTHVMTHFIIGNKNGKELFKIVKNLEIEK